MKRNAVLLLLLVFLLPATVRAQYYGERPTEQSFERSDFYFQSHYLNPYGLDRFRDIAAGTLDDPFLDLHINPANLPDIDSGVSLFYFDFRGDRTEAPIIGHYFDVMYGDEYSRYPDPYYYTAPRQEPEPVFSFGLLAYPFRERLEKLFIGGTYQLIYTEEPYYRPPYWVRYYGFGYDVFGERNVDDQGDFPVQERYFGKDELTTEGHLFSAFMGVPLSPRTDAGVSINGVRHSRDGGYTNRRADEYGGTDTWNYRSHTEQWRNQDYTHFDINGGLRCAVSPRTSLGITAGYLSGDADQSAGIIDSSLNTYNDSLSAGGNWNYYYRRGNNRQTWKRDGHTAYLRANFDHAYPGGGAVSGYYHYGNIRADLSNSSEVFDTSYSASHWVWGENVSDYHSASAGRDQRTAQGTREGTTHRALVNWSWTIDARTQVLVSGFLSRRRAETRTNEPVIADRWSEVHSVHTETGRSDREHRLYEDKRLEWNHRTTYWTVQIPVLLRHRVNERFRFRAGVNRILEKWTTSETIVARFARRERTDGEGTRVETDFVETYTQPERKYTKTHTAVMGGIDVMVSPRFLIEWQVEPKSEDGLGISQWWLSFRLKT